MAKPKVTGNPTRGGAEDEQHRFQGTNHELNGQAPQGDTLVVTKNGDSDNGSERQHHHGNGRAGATLAAPALLKGQPSAELAEKIKELVRLAQEQGYLTYNDSN